MRKQIKDIKEGLFLYATDIENCYFDECSSKDNYEYERLIIEVIDIIKSGHLWHETQEPKRMAGVYANSGGVAFNLYKKDNIFYWLNNEKCQDQYEWHRIPTIPEWEIDENNKPIEESK